MSTLAATAVLRLEGLSKSFGGAKALDGVDLEIRPGEVHGLLGENGSGKSTLIKVLNGFHAPDPGAVLEVGGAVVELPLAPGRFRDLGLAFVHQDLGLVTDVSVVENLGVGDLLQRRSWWIDWRAEHRRARETFARYGLQIDPAALVSALTETERALLAIVRAVEEIRAGQAERGHAGGLLVLDEPTVFLPREGVAQLFAIVREIVAGGETSVLFVSHDLDEVLELCDRVTVLRDGRLQGTVAAAETSERELVELIIGRDLAGPTAAPAAELRARPVDVRVRGLGAGRVHDLDLDLHEGEVLGVTGLMGSGFEELPYLLFGARPCSAGTLETRGATYQLAAMTPARAVADGMALLPADRVADGSVGTLSVADNVMLQVLSEHCGAAGLRRGPLAARAAELLDEYDVRPAAPELAYGSLSGGNQQKALLAKWLQCEPSLILLHEPTQGVDVGARAQIYALLRRVADAGAAVVCATSDAEQLVAVCDRVLIFGRGRVVRELAGAEITKDRIAQLVLSSVSLDDSIKED